jgi:MFS family permease
MAILIVTWSGFTALTGFSHGVGLLLVARFGCGLAEAGAYPISSSLLSRWAHVSRRALCGAIVPLGGRLGFALAPGITSLVIGSAGSWRWAGWSYGVVGIAVGALFWAIFRESPEVHPRCNVAEKALLAEGRDLDEAPHAPVRRGFPWRSVLTDRSLWLMCGYQLLTNYGWAFVINSQSDYLKQVRHLDDRMNGNISTITMVIGLFGLLLGGIFTDALTKKFGLRLGRLLPLSVTRFASAAMFVVCLWVHNPWLLAVCLGLMVFSTDSGLPATWAWAQDVGGRNVAPIFGWANMWGNFGAAIQPLLTVWLLARFDPNHDQHVLFVAGAVAFTLAGILSLGINAAREVKGA